MIPKCNSVLKAIGKYVSSGFLICCSGNVFKFPQKKKVSVGCCACIK